MKKDRTLPSRRDLMQTAALAAGALAATESWARPRPRPM